MARDEWAEAKAAHERADYATEFRLYQQLADAGDARAQTYLGVMYEKGRGVDAGFCGGAETGFARPPKQGDARAHCNVGSMYDRGRGVAQDYAEAMKWYRPRRGPGRRATRSTTSASCTSADAACQRDDVEAAQVVPQGRRAGLRARPVQPRRHVRQGPRRVRRTIAEAMKWFRKAADQNHAKAQFNIGFMYEHGHGVPQNYAGAMSWYRKAADQGDAAAQTNVGSMYATGRGVADRLCRGDEVVPAGGQPGRRHGAVQRRQPLRDRARRARRTTAVALKWYLKAAEQGDAVAQNHVGNMYATGQGVTRDYAEAMSWYTKAAEQGDASAQNNLGSMYAAGKAVPRDLVQAHKWYTLAAAHFPADEAAFRDKAIRNADSDRGEDVAGTDRGGAAARPRVEAPSEAVSPAEPRAVAGAEASAVAFQPPPSALMSPTLAVRRRPRIASAVRSLFKLAACSTTTTI